MSFYSYGSLHAYQLLKYNASFTVAINLKSPKTNGLKWTLFGKVPDEHEKALVIGESHNEL